MWNTLQSALQTIVQVNPYYALLALALYVSSFFLVGWRWKIMIHALGGKAHLMQTTLANITSIFINNVTPSSGLGGEACRIALIRDRDHVPLKIATVSSVYDRVSEFPVVGLLILLALPSVYHVLSGFHQYATVLALVTVAALSLLLLYRKIEKLQNAIRSLLVKIQDLKISVRTYLYGSFVSLLLWTEDLIRIWVVAYAFGVTLNPSQIAAIVVFTIFGRMIPTVGGLGVIEGGMVAGLVLFGVSVDTAIAITALERAISYAFGALAGGVTLSFMGGFKMWRAAKGPGKA